MPPGCFRTESTNLGIDAVLPADFQRVGDMCLALSHRLVIELGHLCALSAKCVRAHTYVHTCVNP